MSLRSAMEEGFKAAAERFKTADVSPLLLRAIRNALPGGIVGSFAADEGHRGSGAMRGRSSTVSCPDIFMVTPMQKL